MSASNRYANCDHVQKIPFVNDCDEETKIALGENYDIPPLYENGMFKKAFIKHYSLVRNEFLNCRWREYVRGIESRQFSPFELPDIRELHFYNCAIRFHPPASIRHQDHRKTLKPGPGVDHLGIMPIPQESLMKRGAVTIKSDRINKTVAKKDKKGAKKKVAVI